MSEITQSIVGAVIGAAAALGLTYWEAHRCHQRWPDHTTHYNWSIAQCQVADALTRTWLPEDQMVILQDLRES